MNKPVILVTGGTGKLGSVVVKFLSKLPVKVVFTGRSSEKIEKLINECAELNPAQVHGINMDHQQPDAADRLAEKLLSMDLLPTHIVNNVRDIGNLKVDDQGRPSYEVWHGEFQLAVVFPYELALQVIRLGGALQRIVNVSSMYGLVPANPHLYINPIKDSPIQYGIVKAAQNHLTKEMAIRFANKGIRVNGIAYGGVEGRVDEAFKQRYANLCPISRMLKEEEVPGIVQYLLLDAPDALTGQTIAVDGGWTVW